MRHCFLSTIWLSICIPALAAQTTEDLRLVPYPRQATLEEGRCELRESLTLTAPDVPGDVLGRLLNEELRRAGLPAAKVNLGGPDNSFRLASKPGAAELALPGVTNAPEKYALAVRPAEIIAAAETPAGLLYSMQTLCQLIRANRQGSTLPCLSIQDWPALRWRCFQDDMTRGSSSKLETLQFEAGLGAYLKFNLMTFYMEYQYAFAKHPRIGPTNGSLTPQELTALIEFARPLHLDILGNQQSFGHFGQILKHPEYAHLREVADVLTPVKEETYQLLDDLYSEVCPLLAFPWFNVCCDETWGLGTGPSKTLAQEIGVGGVYVRHIRRVHDLLRDKYKKRMMMWGDIILQHPERLKDVPKDTIMLTWGYDARASFEDQIVPFARSGYEFWVCPGVNNWSRILPDFGVAMTNIRHFVRDGLKHGAVGMLNTDWEDDGEAINAVKWHADAWAAECAWGGARTTPEAFNRRVGAVLFGESSDHFGQAIELLSRTHRMPALQGMMNSRFWRNDFLPQGSPAAIHAVASNLLAIVEPAIGHLKACRGEARVNVQVLDAILFGARRTELIGRRMLDGLRTAELYDRAVTLTNSKAALPLLQEVQGLIQGKRDLHEALGGWFAALWLSESKPYALDWTTNRYARTVRWYDDVLARLAQSQTAAAAGKRLLTPEELGLPLPTSDLRRTKIRVSRGSVLAANEPWVDRAATHRFGVVLCAGSADRFDTPFEIDVPVPAELGKRSMRAFRLETNGSAYELAGQLDAGTAAGRRRLVLVVPGSLPKGSELPVHVYLDGSTPASLPQAVAQREAGNGRHWIENDRVRFLLGPEGAHVYRWEVKGAKGRDLTMPGESGWAGFSDIANYRQETYRLEVLSRGPALVRYQCVSSSGQTKTLSLFAGASWIEVFLSQPTPVYWDFDDPRNFAADGPTPGTYLFSTGKSGQVGREADGVPAQVKARDAFWGIKFNADRLALGIATPDVAAHHHLAPGAGAGGAGIESSTPTRHFVTFAGQLEASPPETMERLCQTLSVKNPPEAVLYRLEEAKFAGQR